MRLSKSNYELLLLRNQPKTEYHKSYADFNKTKKRKRSSSTLSVSFLFFYRCSGIHIGFGESQVSSA